MTENSTNKVVDLFAGCGGLSLGFENAGFDIVGAFENWDKAADCYARNFSHPLFRTDLSEVERAIAEARSLSPDIIIGGPPCQDFSHAGKRIEDKRAKLTEAFANIVADIRPRFFVMENVARAFKSAAYASAKAIFKRSGYGLTEIVLDASRCGVPQKRKRFFCFGALEANDGFLLKEIERDLRDKDTTIREYFGSSLGLEFYYRHPRNYNRRAIYSVDEPSPTIRGANRPIPPGYSIHPNDACEINCSVRPLTTIERSLIQTFPADFKWVGNKTEMELMIANAVPVKLAEFVASALMRYIVGKERKITA
ncbi:MAG: DNA cytosine methyltransferase [Helicobacteraceae bacterium]|jgi:DNA (cytosine-5)-methyltransferase 1|nr:DNA cytosine methyltransferase [Helicobacteraceae bacterium]